MGGQARDVNFWNKARLDIVRDGMSAPGRSAAVARAIMAVLNDGLDEGEAATLHMVRGAMRRLKARPDSEPNGEWSEAAKTAIGEAYRSGLSAGEVAFRFDGKFDDGRRLTRDMVRNIALRSGFVRPPERVRSTQQAVGLRGRAHKARRLAKAVRAKPSEPEIVAAPPAAPALPARELAEVRPFAIEGMRLVGLDGRGNGCAYIAEGSRDAYCGRPVALDTRLKRYCLEHHRMMYQPGQPLVRPAKDGAVRLPNLKVRRGGGRLFEAWS